MKLLYNIVYFALLRVGQGSDPDSPSYGNELEQPSTATEGALAYPLSEQEIEDDKTGKRWMNISTFKPIRDFLPEGSSMSVIRYSEKIETASDKELETHIPCDAHYDTGIVTFILISEVPGLEVVDQVTKKWIPLEKLGRPGDLVLILGRKVQMLFNPNAKLNPTFHQVQIPKSVRRHSILFFCDIPAGPDKD
jgi:hypothetical protein